MSQAKLNDGIENWGEEKMVDHKYTGMYEHNHYTSRFMNFRWKKININVTLAIKLIIDM